MKSEQTEQTLLSLPNSLRNQMQRAQNLLDQSGQADSHGDRSLAVVKAREAMKVVQTLAQSAPEAAALIILADLGYRGFEYETVERTDRHEVIERKLFGISFGHEVVNVPTIKRRHVRGRIF